MSDELTNDQKKPFELIKHHADDGTEYWSARDLMVKLGYGDSWENFVGVINRAITSAENSQISLNTSLAFRKATKSYTGRNRHGEFESTKADYHLSRFASYLVAQNGDPAKPEIALAQAYFAIQTYRQEQIQNMSEDERRLYIRSQVTDENKKLHKAAQDSGVYRFGTFYDAGYIGLYGMTAKQIRKHKQLGDDNILDRAGATELAANLFRITQTQEKLQSHLRSGQTVGDRLAAQTHFMIGGKVRQTIKDIKGTLPEHLNPEENIKEVQKKIKAADKKKLQSAEKPLKIEQPFEKAMKKIANAKPPKE